LQRAIGLLLRLYAYLFHLGLALFLLGVGLVAASSGKSLALPMLPWTEDRLTQAVLVLGVTGLVCILLAAMGWLRWLFPIWALTVLVLMIRGFFLSSFTYSGPQQFRQALGLTLGALVAFFGSLGVFGRTRRRY